MKIFFLMLGMFFAGQPSFASDQEDPGTEVEAEEKPAKARTKAKSAARSGPELFTGIGMMSPEIIPAEFMVRFKKTDLPSWVNSSLNAALNSSLDPYEEEIADGLYDAYGREYDTQPLPVTGISGGIYF
jgi:hypothetical protein